MGLGKWKSIKAEYSQAMDLTLQPPPAFGKPVRRRILRQCLSMSIPGLYRSSPADTALPGVSMGAQRVDLSKCGYLEMIAAKAWGGVMRKDSPRREGGCPNEGPAGFSADPIPAGNDGGLSQVVWEQVDMMYIAARIQFGPYRRNAGTGEYGRVQSTRPLHRKRHTDRARCPQDWTGGVGQGLRILVRAAKTAPMSLSTQTDWRRSSCG